MTYTDEWNEAYKKNTHMSIWPWSDLVSCVYRYANPKNGYRNVLELGCGAGANIPLFLALNCNYYAIEGSQTITTQLVETYPKLKGKIITCDFSKTYHSEFNNYFDLIVDRASITHNNTLAIKSILEFVIMYLRPGGKFIGIDWFSTRHGDFIKGDTVDNYTKKNLPQDSQFSNIGQVHFSDKEHIIELFTDAGLIVDRLEHKERISILPDNNFHFASWDIIAHKPL
ncbi:class I SAM-dependent methyltransferase [Aeromonas encheleia]|uniref:class I SAM-dependent methyltransferase n=1 Tax=Aeromonas encheleia TaxID=73010 RepID=UPI001F5758E9|nr:class I SAM-dependent methyltransferase [Aeromonas encheleia]UNP87320.1 class I SAM-dependent methyltransferase [Aeromonas encheleia]